ncbi:MAG: DUF86 domain-containing protein [Candidatus Margulisbacteria bacterium]|nr:DUF86 domain-containing protein [Candidatus Margulisiibacteriota bacterium]
MILQKDQIQDIVQRLEFIKLQLADLGKFASLTWQVYRTDRDTQRNIERLVENVANAAIDICKIVLAGEDVEMPNSYKEIIIKLGEIKVLDEKKAEKIADYAGLRNILAHQYLDIKWEKIKAFIQNAGDDFEEFIKEINKKIKSA